MSTTCEEHGRRGIQIVSPTLRGKRSRGDNSLCVPQTQLSYCICCTKMADPLLHPGQIQAQAVEAVRAVLIRGHGCGQLRGMEFIFWTISLHFWIHCTVCPAPSGGLRSLDTPIADGQTVAQRFGGFTFGTRPAGQVHSGARRGSGRLGGRGGDAGVHNHLTGGSVLTWFQA